MARAKRATAEERRLNNLVSDTAQRLVDTERALRELERTSSERIEVVKKEKAGLETQLSHERDDKRRLQEELRKSKEEATRLSEQLSTLRTRHAQLGKAHIALATAITE